MKTCIRIEYTLASESDVKVFPIKEEKKAEQFLKELYKKKFELANLSPSKVFKKKYGRVYVNWKDEKALKEIPLKVSITTI